MLTGPGPGWRGGCGCNYGGVTPSAFWVLLPKYGVHLPVMSFFFFFLSSSFLCHIFFLCSFGFSSHSYNGILTPSPFSLAGNPSVCLFIVTCLPSPVYCFVLSFICLPHQLSGILHTAASCLFSPVFISYLLRLCLFIYFFLCTLFALPSHSLLHHYHLPCLSSPSLRHR